MDITKEKDFKDLYNRYFSTLYRSAYNVLNSEQSAEDVVHQVFLKLWEQRAQVEITDNLGGYLHRAVINTALNFLKKHRQLTSMETVPDHDLVEESSKSIDDQEQQQAIHKKLLLIVDALPPKCKIVFSLSRYEGLSNQEIADHLGVTRKTVENQLNKAFSRIRNMLGPLLKHLSGLITAMAIQIFF